MSFFRTLCLLAAWLAVVPLHALTWDATRIAVDADPFDESTQVTYRFVNAGTKPVHITSAFSSCGCTVPHLAKLDYAPGEHGELVAVFTMGQVVGDQIRTITVTTDEPADRRTCELTLEARVAQVLQVNPSIVTWQKGEPLRPKTIAITVGRPDIRLTKIESRDGRLNAVIEPGTTAGNTWKITLEPRTTAGEFFTPILVTMNRPVQNPRVLIVYAKVIDHDAAAASPSN